MMLSIFKLLRAVVNLFMVLLIVMEMFIEKGLADLEQINTSVWVGHSLLFILVNVIDA